MVLKLIALKYYGYCLITASTTVINHCILSYSYYCILLYTIVNSCTIAEIRELSNCRCTIVLITYCYETILLLTSIEAYQQNCYHS